MHRGFCLAALSACLGGGLADLKGQETVWRPAGRSAGVPAITARAVPAEPPRATLGRPVVVSRGVSGYPVPRPFPAEYQNLPAAPAWRYTGGVEPIATVAPPGAVIAVSAPSSAALPAVSEEYADSFGDLFAMDRVEQPPTPRPQPTRWGPVAPISPVQVSLVPGVAPARPAPGLSLERVGNWTGTYPVTPPDPDFAPGFTETVVEELPPTKWYARGEYLLWWTKNDRTPPLVTTGPANLVNFSEPPIVGALGSPGTAVLFGGELDRNPFSGGRFTFGYYFDDCGGKAIELSAFWLGQRSANFQADSFSNSVITRPFLDVVGEGNVPPNTPFVQYVSFPGAFLGKITVEAPSELWGVELNVPCRWCCGCDWRVDLIGGVRYLQLRESLTVQENVLFAEDNPILPGANILVRDHFGTRNQFYGGQIGIEGRWQHDRLTLDGRVKVAAGVTHQRLQIEGSQVRLFQGQIDTFTGGLLALDSNIGSFQRERFAVVPEGTVTVGYYLTDRLRALLGYNFLYWSNVARPGDQIDLQLDPGRIPNFRQAGPGVPNPAIVPARPAVLFRSTDYWAHGLTLGLEYRY